MLNASRRNFVRWIILIVKIFFNSDVRIAVDLHSRALIVALRRAEIVALRRAEIVILLKVLERVISALILSLEHLHHLFVAGSLKSNLMK